MTSPYDNLNAQGWDLSARTDMNGLTITGLCLSNETPNAQVLPQNLKGVTFIDCNLDNVFVPSGNTMIRGSNRLFKVQNDGEDWILHPQTLTPIAPVNPQLFTAVGLSTNPANIPVTFLGKSIVLQTIEVQTAALQQAQANVTLTEALQSQPVLTAGVS